MRPAARRSATTSSRPTTSSPPPRRMVSRGSCRRRARRSWACPSTSRPCSRRSTRPSSHGLSPRTRWRSSWARRWRDSSTGGPGSRSWGFGSRTSWSRTTTPRSPATGMMRRSGSGTCGATSTVRDVAQACGSGSRRAIDGAEVCIIAAADTVMTALERRAHGRGLPGRAADARVEGRETLLSIDHARRVLGYEPAHRWADHVATP